MKKGGKDYSALVQETGIRTKKAFEPPNRIMNKTEPEDWKYDYDFPTPTEGYKDWEKPGKRDDEGYHSEDSKEGDEKTFGNLKKKAANFAKKGKEMAEKKIAAATSSGKLPEEESVEDEETEYNWEGKQRLKRYMGYTKNMTHQVFSLMKISDEDWSIFLDNSPEVVLVDVVNWNYIGAKNWPSYQGERSTSIYRWLQLPGYPKEVHDFFRRYKSEDQAEGQAKLATYYRGTHLIHLASTEILDPASILNLAKAFENVFHEYQAGFDRGILKPGTKLLLSYPYLENSDNLDLNEVIPQMTISALAIALLRVPEELWGEKITSQFQFYIPQTSLQKYQDVMHVKKSMLNKAAPYELNDTLNEVPRFNGHFGWVMKETTTESRMSRLSAFFDTKLAFWRGSYKDSHGTYPKFGSFKNIDKMVSGTRVFLVKDCIKTLSTIPCPKHATKFMRLKKGKYKCDTTAMGLASVLAKKGFKIASYNAGSAYGCGGGVTTGGRHAQEEAWCMTSTIHRSLTKILIEKKTEPVFLVPAKKRSWRGPEPEQQMYPAEKLWDLSPGIDDQVFQAYIPSAGCILSPGVEIFRRSTMQGYKFMPEPISLSGVITTAAFNCNPGVHDSPLDCPVNEAEYLARLKQKWVVALIGAIHFRSEVIVIPDVGCGVFQNDPDLSGVCLREALRPTAGYFKTVIIVGKEAFVDAALSERPAQDVLVLPDLDDKWMSENHKVLVGDQWMGGRRKDWNDDGWEKKPESPSWSPSPRETPKASPNKKIIYCKGCGKECDAALCCPKCSENKVASFFCNQSCFVASWKVHKRTHADFESLD